MPNKSVITAAEAARLLGVTPQMVRERMKRGLWDIGIVVEPEDGKIGKRYDISRVKVEKLIKEGF